MNSKFLKSLVPGILILGLVLSLNVSKAIDPPSTAVFSVWDTFCCKNKKITGNSNDCVKGGSNCVDNTCANGATEVGRGECSPD